MTLESKSIGLLMEALEQLEAGFGHMPPFDPGLDPDALRTVLGSVARRMQDNYPYQHPFYMGQMIKPPHAVARLAYALSLWINPNNHALDGGRASSAMEKEAVAEIANLFGWTRHLGHLTAGGTMANLEALWIARCLAPGKKILASEQAHYTHHRICGVLGIPFEAVPCDPSARMDMAVLRAMLKKGNVGTVVVTIGTTATGSVDPLLEVLTLQEEYGFRIHADSAYGGYYILANNLRPDTAVVYRHLAEVDSIVVDPHKHGLQPYGCGCVLFKEPSVGRFYKHDSPYTYFTSSELHLGEISLECSRAGAAAVALWATQRVFPLVRGGDFAQGLERCRVAALRFFELLRTDPRFMTAYDPELDIVVWTLRAASASEASHLASAVFESAAARDLHLAKANLPKSIFAHHWPTLQWDQDHITCLRSCIMKPEHLEWMDRIWERLDAATKEVVSD
jgi:tyrosine decarboxylase / aspartate 1-decarboxylase